jgi:DtxR family Mn-dependent transcriptional regulator
VSLTRAGRKLATRVLRRHRLVELFLVQVMGLSWDEVHEEAELLEHVVSDRLIDRMDEMLGWPEVESARAIQSPMRMASLNHRKRSLY